MKHTVTTTVRSYELDSYNHVNNANYLNYLEFGRIEFLRAINFDYTALVEEGFQLFITQIHIQYKVPACLFDELSIVVEPKKLGKVSGVFHQQIFNQKGDLCVDAEVTWACVHKSGRPSKIPDHLFVSGLMPST